MDGCVYIILNKLVGSLWFRISKLRIDQIMLNRLDLFIWISLIGYFNFNRILLILTFVWVLRKGKGKNEKMGKFDNPSKQ